MVRQGPPKYWDRDRPSVSPGLCTLISDVRISVLVLDSVVDDVAMIESPETICDSDSSRLFCDIDSLKRLAGGTVRSCDASPLKVVVINWLADNPLTENAMLGT